MTSPADYRPAPGSVPTRPGVYRFRDPHGRVLYVGKAKNLRSRLANYFADPATLHPRTRAMVTTASSVDWTIVRTEVEALILEHTWIKQYDPTFNVVFRDDKSYPFLAITMNEDVPRIHVVRGVRKPGVRYFGPYANAGALRETVDALLTVLPMRSCSIGVFRKAERQGRPCLLGYIGKCAAPCVGRISVEDHRNLANRVADVLLGDAKSVVRELTAAMESAAAREDFEAAARARDRLRALNTVLSLNAVVLAESTNADLFTVVNDEYEAAAHLFRVRAGRIVGERGWVVDKPEPADDASLMSQLLAQVYGDAAREDIPREVLVPAIPHDATALSAWLQGLRGAAVTITVPQRGKRVELAATSQANAQEVLARHRLKRSSDITARSRALQELGELVGMERGPLRIECYDISHLQGSHQVGSMVVFEDALPIKREYRQFSVPDGLDDVAALGHVLHRRLQRYLEQRELPLEERDSAKFAYPPQLLVVDGGPAQVNAAAHVAESLGLGDIPVVGIAKRLEELWLPHQEFPVIAPRGSEAMYLIQRLRDEAHRFAISKHRGKRSRALTSTGLDDIPGVGPTRAAALLRHFGSLARVKDASVHQIALVPGIGAGIAQSIYDALHGGRGMLEP